MVAVREKANGRGSWRYGAVVLLALVAAAIPTVAARGSLDNGQANAPSDPVRRRSLPGSRGR